MSDSRSFNTATPLRVGSLGTVAAVLWVIDGLPGVVLAGVVGVAWFGIETPYVVAGGQLLFAVLTTHAGMLGVIGVVSFGVLFVPRLVEQWSFKTAAVAISVLAGLTAFFTGSLLFATGFRGILAVSLGFGLIAYGIHRYEVVRFGLVDTTL